ncbi:MAG: iron-containing alcohol dehydrogenase, partial [Thermoanaerobaculia bacterium]|nr:iron-containing alcohol dehydrogenase [Thermoanaerobaculia bacterium]
REEVRALGCARAVVVTDEGLAKGTDVPARIEKALGDSCAGVFSDVVPDSGVHIVDAGAAFARERGADCIVSVGGGSAIDTAKGIAIVLREGGSLRDYEGFQVLKRRATPHVAIPTTAGTGSEVTYVAVIKDHEAHQKLLFGDYNIIPNTALLDPELTVGLPPHLTAATGMDAMSHAVEAIHSQQNEPIADGLALHAIRLIAEFLPRAVANGKDLVARGQMLIASNMAGAAFSNAQVGLVHAMAHTVGARYGVHHGLANSIVMPHVVRFNAAEVAATYRPVAAALGISIDALSDEACAEAVAARLSDLAGRAGLPQTLASQGVPEAALPELAEATLDDASIIYNGRAVLGADEVLEVYRAAF